MPLIEIHALPQPSHIDPSAVLAAVNRAVGEAIGRPSNTTWSTWNTIAPGHYAVGESLADLQPTDTHDPIVHVYAERSADAFEQIVDAIVITLSESLGIEPGNVFVTTSRVSPHLS